MFDPGDPKVLEIYKVVLDGEVLKAKKQAIATWLCFRKIALKIVLSQLIETIPQRIENFHQFIKIIELNTSDWNWKVCQLCFYKPELCPAPRQLTIATKVQLVAQFDYSRRQRNLVQCFAITKLNIFFVQGWCSCCCKYMTWFLFILVLVLS